MNNFNNVYVKQYDFGNVYLNNDNSVSIEINLENMQYFIENNIKKYYINLTDIILLSKRMISIVPHSFYQKYLNINNFNKLIPFDVEQVMIVIISPNCDNFYVDSLLSNNVIIYTNNIIHPFNVIYNQYQVGDVNQIIGSLTYLPSNCMLYQFINKWYDNDTNWKYNYTQKIQTYLKSLISNNTFPSSIEEINVAYYDRQLINSIRQNNVKQIY